MWNEFGIWKAVQVDTVQIRSECIWITLPLTPALHGPDTVRAAGLCISFMELVSPFLLISHMIMANDVKLDSVSILYWGRYNMGKFHNHHCAVDTINELIQCHHKPWALCIEFSADRISLHHLTGYNLPYKTKSETTTTTRNSVESPIDSGVIGTNLRCEKPAGCFLAGKSKTELFFTW